MVINDLLQHWVHVRLRWTIFLSGLKQELLVLPLKVSELSILLKLACPCCFHMSMNRDGPSRQISHGVIVNIRDWTLIIINWLGKFKGDEGLLCVLPTCCIYKTKDRKKGAELWRLRSDIVQYRSFPIYFIFMSPIF